MSKNEQYKQHNRERHRQLRAARRLAGLCYDCDTPSVDGRILCSRHLEASRVASRTQRQRRRQNGACRDCPAPCAEGHTRCQRCLETKRNIKRQMRLRAYAGYGNRCNCPGCPETNPDTFEIDHVNGNGNEHRRRDPSAGHISCLVIKLGFPPDYQILCGSCHNVKTRGGKCNHAPAPVRTPQLLDTFPLAF